jgi:hypothetical protein
MKREDKTAGDGGNHDRGISELRSLLQKSGLTLTTGLGRERGKERRRERDREKKVTEKESVSRRFYIFEILSP